MKTVITAQELLEIHKIASLSWKETIRSLYLSRITLDQNIHFSKDEINEMFKESTFEQFLVLEKIFGKQVKPIEWDRIKTGSKVMIQYNGEHYYGFHKIDNLIPVDVVFFKAPHIINIKNEFELKAFHNSYCTFHQNGKYVLFAADENTDYIVEVIEY